MKVSETNYNKIKAAFTRYLSENNLSMKQLSIGNFSSLHTHIHMQTRKANHVLAERHHLTSWINEKGEFAFPDYELYPDNCNDDHLETVYKRLIKEL